MYKSKLHEFCQSKRISMPEYTTRKEGFDHCPGFKAVVNVNGLSFTPKKLSRNSKEAQNQAAKLAFDHFTNNGSSSGTNALPPASSIIVQPRIPELSQNASFGQTTFMTKDDERFKDMAHLYKNRLQFYAQKSNLALPAYTFEREGPPHASRFKSKVTVGGQIYESPEYFNTVKEAENAAAKVAFLGLSPGGAEEDDTGFSKKLLQVFLQREYSCLPKYTTSQSGASHVPTFVSTVDINGETFRGDEAKTKKQAEANAAKVAYIAFKDRRQGLEAHSIKSNIKQLQHQPEPVTMSENNRGRQGLEAHSIKSNIKQLQHQPEPVTMSENNRGRQGLEAHSIKSNIKQLQHQPEPVTMSENNRGRQGLEAHSIKSNIKQLQHQPEPVTMSENNRGRQGLEAHSIKSNIKQLQHQPEPVTMSENSRGRQGLEAHSIKSNIKQLQHQPEPVTMSENNRGRQGLEAHSIKSNIKQLQHQPEPVTMSENNRGRQGLEAHSIKSNIKQLQHQPEPVTMSENNRGRQGLEAHSIKSNIKQLQHQPEPVTMSENSRGRQGLEAHSIKSNIKQLQHQPEPVTMSENNRGRQGLEAHSIKSNIKQLQHQPEPVTMSENNRGRQGLEAHSIKSNIKQLQHQPEPVTMSENSRGRQGLEAHSIKSNIKQLQHQPEPVTMSENNRVVPEKAAKSVHVMETPEVVEEKDTESSSLQNPLQAVSQSEKVDSSAVASSEEGQALTDSVEKVSINGPTASVPPGRRPRRKIVTRPFKPGMEIPPRAILRFCDEKYIAYEVPNED